MNSNLALTSFTRDYDYPKLCDIWSSRVHFSKFKINNFYRCRPSCFFVYSSRFFFKKTQLKNFNLVITLIYDFKPIVVKIIPFTSLITTLSFAKDPFRPILFAGFESGQIHILNLDSLDNVQLFQPNFSQSRPVQLSDWLNDEIILFSYPTRLYGWNIESGQINLLYDSSIDGDNKITYFTCTAFQPRLVSIGLSNGEILIMNQTTDEKIVELFRIDHHKHAISSLSFTFGLGKYANPVLATIDMNGVLCVWNLDKRVRIFEDNKLRVTRESQHRCTVAFMDDLYDLNDKPDLQQKTTFENPEFIKFLAIQLKKDSSYFLLLVTNSNGILFEYKVPKYLTSSDFNPFPVPFKIKQYKFNKIFTIHMPTSFQINHKRKIKKGDNQMLINNNNFPIMIQVVQRNFCFNFLVNDLLQKRLVQEIPLLANAITSIDFSRLNPNKTAIPDVGGFLIWHAPNFNSKNNQVYDLVNKRKGFYVKKCQMRVTCLQWHPDRENIIVLGTRTGHIYVYDIQTRDDPVEQSIALRQDVYKSLYIYGISWGPNVLDKPGKDEAISIMSPKQTFDYIYCLVDDGKIVIVNLFNKRTMDFKEIADILLEKQWTELSWKSDYKLLAVGNKEGSVDIFANELFKFAKLKHIITINDALRSPIESISWHPILIKSLEDSDNESGPHHESVKVVKSASHHSNLNSQIAIAGTENAIKIVNLCETIEKSNEEFDLPLVINSVDKTLTGHEGRVFRTCWSTFRENHLLSCSEDTTVKVWNCNLPVGQELWKTYYGHFNRTLVARWSMSEPDVVFSGGNDSIVSVWNINQVKDEKPKQIEAIQSACVVAKPNQFEYVINEEEENAYEPLHDGVRSESRSELSEEGERLTRFTTNDHHETRIIGNENEYNERLAITYFERTDHSPKGLSASAGSRNASNIVSVGNSMIDRFEIEKKIKNVSTNSPNYKSNVHNVTNWRDEMVDKKDRVKNECSQDSSNVTNKCILETSKKRKSTKNRYDSKVKSLLTLSTCYDNSLTKLEHFIDLDKMMAGFEERMCNLKVSEENLAASNNKDAQSDNSHETQSDKQTRLLYGSSEDVSALSKFEIANHLKNDDSESACLVKLLSTNLKTVIDEATKQNQLNDFLVAMSPSVSLDYYHQTTSNYVDQLAREGKIVIAASYLLSLFRIKDALDLLVKSKLYKEALMVAKTRFTSRDNIYVRVITHALARDYSRSGNFESEAKCWLSIDHYYEAARVLAARIDPLSTRYAVKCCKIAYKYELEN